MEDIVRITEDEAEDFLELEMVLVEEQQQVEEEVDSHEKVAAA